MINHNKDSKEKLTQNNINHSKRLLGCFVSCAGGLYKSIDNAEELEVNTMMIHPAPPQKWNSQPFKQEDIDKYNQRMIEHKKNAAEGKITLIEKVYFHGIYLINLANPDKQKFHLSKMSLVNHLELCEKIGADGVIFHTGSFKDIPEEQGYEKILFGINWIFEHVEVKGQKLILECAAGAGNVVGHKFEQLQKIYEGLSNENRKKVGFCLDTQHMFGSGYDLVNQLDETMRIIESTIGIKNILAVHFNDSKVELASNRDRHENLGEGKIGEVALTKFLNHPELKDKPFILETPALKDLEGAQAELKKLRCWCWHLMIDMPVSTGHHYFRILNLCQHY